MDTGHASLWRTRITRQAFDDGRNGTCIHRSGFSRIHGCRLLSPTAQVSLPAMSPGSAVFRDTYIVSDPCNITQHEFGTNSARTIEYGQFRCIYRIAEGRLIQRQTNREERKIGRWGTLREEGWRHLRTLFNIEHRLVVDKKGQDGTRNQIE